MYSDILDEMNALDTASDNASIQSQEKNFDDHIPILETVVNRFKTQIILKTAK